MIFTFTTLNKKNPRLHITKDGEGSYHPWGGDNNITIVYCVSYLLTTFSVRSDKTDTINFSLKCQYSPSTNWFL